MFGRIHLARHLLSTCHQTNTLQRARTGVTERRGLADHESAFHLQFSVERLMVRH
jgi:hypothetical protein